MNNPTETDINNTNTNIKNKSKDSEKLESTVASYDVGVLMAQTRMLAADYRAQTGQALPVTEELARFDGINLLGLKKLTEQECIDATNEKGDELYLIKGRVIFKSGKARQKLGQLSLQFNWNQLLMVIYDPKYQPSQIFKISRDIIEKELEKLPASKRGSMTVAKYKAIGQLIWAAED
ncbi:MAG: hypothetical protein ACPGJI_08545 [Kangiellaceae bacterium]